MLVALLFVAPAQNLAACGGNFESFLNGLKLEAQQKGYMNATIERFFSTVEHDPKTIEADRAQSIFRLPFVDFSARLISKDRIYYGKKNIVKYASLFDQIENQFSVPRGILIAFWAFETDFGKVQGNFNTLNSIVSLAHDCRRPELFRPQVFAALELYKNGVFEPATTRGAWAGEIGMVQMLPKDILLYGLDGDEDGQVNLTTSTHDALMSAANLLISLGWRANEPWLQEVTLSNTFDWSLTGLVTEKTGHEWQNLGVRGLHGQMQSMTLPASVLLPQGRHGPAFLAYPNFRAVLEWNKSFVYATTAAYFATIFHGEPPFKHANPSLGLDIFEMKHLQRKLVSYGYDVGKIDGILGSKTRTAVQALQKKLGLPADAWPSHELISLLN